jgi:hypothetical protein
LITAFEEPGPLETKCLIWQGHTDIDGYGKFYWRGLHYFAHRAAYRNLVGEFHEERLICHHCDRPPCLNPDHLYPGDAVTNAADMIARGRKANLKGEENPNARLAEQQVEEVLKLLGDGHSHQQIADSFGVDRQTIGFIARGDTWSHISGERPKPKTTFHSRYVGVRWLKGKWLAGIRVNGPPQHLGSFDTEIDAALAYNAAIIEHGLDRPINVIAADNLSQLESSTNDLHQH